MTSLMLKTDYEKASFSTVKITFRDIWFSKYQIKFECNPRQARDLTVKLCMNPISENIEHLEVLVTDRRTAYVHISSKKQFKITGEILEVCDG